MSWPSQIVIVRHGESEGNLMSADSRAVCNTPTFKYELTPKGVKQAEIARDWLEQKHLLDNHAYFASYYKRSTQTMEIACPSARYIEDARISEANRGIQHAATHLWLEENRPEEVARKNRDGLYHFRPTGGESWPDVELRIHSFIHSLRQDYSGMKVLVVGHGTWMILFERLVLNLPISWATEKFLNDPVHNCEVHVYHGTGKHLRKSETARPCDDGRSWPE